MTTIDIGEARLADEAGYDSRFLSTEVPLPDSSAPADDLALLPYIHFSVRQRLDRRLAEITAVNIDGAALIDVERGDDWHADERLEADEQAGAEVYAHNDLDRGHLVRRRDPVWGADAAAANFDTFSYANAAPQVNVFNQSKDLWLGLEDYLLGFADASDERVAVFTGPVFADDDREYRGILLPEKFFKIAVWMSRGELAATAYVLDQKSLLDGIDARGLRATEEPGAYRTFQVAVSQVATLTGLGLDLMATADRFEPRPDGRAEEWVELRSYVDLRF